MPKAVRVATIARLIELRSQGKQLSNYRHTIQQTRRLVRLLSRLFLRKSLFVYRSSWLVSAQPEP